MRFKIIVCAVILAWLAFSNALFSQNAEFQFKRPIHEVTDQWHKITIPDETFEKVSNDVSDLRILGFTSTGDTVEVPYVLNVLQDQIVQKEVTFNLLNQSKKGNIYFFIVEVPSAEEINRISLSFKELNFDWKVTLEGGNRPDDWYKIIEDYRIVSVKNDYTDYHFTTLRFPKSLYRYYRVSVETDGERSQLLSASVKKEELIPGTFKQYEVLSKHLQEDKKRKETLIDLSLSIPVPVSTLQLEINDGIDFYRNFSIQYLVDSVQSPKGWKYKYRSVYTGVVSSVEDLVFTFRSTVASKWRLVIQNQDNLPLSIGEIRLRGPVHELTARFPDPSHNYFLMYGNEKAYAPAYDIGKFMDKIPANNKILTLGEEQINYQKETVRANPIFENQLWLWAVMAVVIIVLGVFSLRMMKKVP